MIYHLIYFDDYLWYLILHEKQKRKIKNTCFNGRTKKLKIVPTFFSLSPFPTISMLTELGSTCFLARSFFASVSVLLTIIFGVSRTALLRPFFLSFSTPCSTSTIGLSLALVVLFGDAESLLGVLGLTLEVGLVAFLDCSASEEFSGPGVTPRFVGRPRSPSRLLRVLLEARSLASESPRVKLVTTTLLFELRLSSLERVSLIGWIELELDRFLLFS